MSLLDVRKGLLQAVEKKVYKLIGFSKDGRIYPQRIKNVKSCCAVQKKRWSLPMGAKKRFDNPQGQDYHKNDPWQG